MSVISINEIKREESSTRMVLPTRSSTNTYNTIGIVTNIFSVMYGFSTRLTTTLSIYLAYRGSSARGVKEVTYSLVMDILNNLYSNAGLDIRDEVCFSCLADAGVIDDRTALYLTTLYFSIEELLDELEEGEGDVSVILRRISEELGELVDILTQVYYLGETLSFVTSQVQETQLSIPYII